jgi:hypothetical protein
MLLCVKFELLITILLGTLVPPLMLIIYHEDIFINLMEDHRSGTPDEPI